MEDRVFLLSDSDVVEGCQKKALRVLWSQRNLLIGPTVRRCLKGVLWSPEDDGEKIWFSLGFL